MHTQMTTPVPYIEPTPTHMHVHAIDDHVHIEYKRSYAF